MPRRPRYPAHPCPRCGRHLDAEGELTMGAAIMPVYQCEHCTVVEKFCGEDLETYLTFAVGPDGGLHGPGLPGSEG